MSGRYGINIYEKINQEMTGYAVDVSDDEHVLIGMSQTKGYGYIIRLPETFTEATSKIDPLEAFSVYPAAGSHDYLLEADLSCFRKYGPVA